MCNICISLLDDATAYLTYGALHTMTPDEYFEKAGKVADSPECGGGGK